MKLDNDHAPGGPGPDQVLHPKVLMRPPGGLKPAKRNARLHSERQIAQLAASIEQFGFTNPILTDDEGRIVAGHGRVEAATRLGLELVPTIALSHLSEDQVRAYVIADNKLALNAGWDEDALRLEFAALEAVVEFDLEITGFSTGEIEVLFDKAGTADARLDETPLKRRHTATVVRGDLWQLGSHRLLCGDAREPADFERVMQGERARMVFSDPPYNVKIDGHVGGLGNVKHAEFAMAAGEMSPAQFTEFLRVAFANAAAVSVDGAVHYQCMDWRHVVEMMEAGNAVYSQLLNMCVWVKDNAAGWGPSTAPSTS